MIARRAATEGDKASGECTVRCLLPCCLSFLNFGLWWLSWELSWCPRRGITTGEEGVIGRELGSLTTSEVVVFVGVMVAVTSGFGREFFLFPALGRSYFDSFVCCEVKR